jgi:S1-C subfamily serine protease
MRTMIPGVLLALLLGAGSAAAQVAVELGTPPAADVSAPAPRGWLGLAVMVEGRGEAAELRVRRVFEGGPAQRAGLRPGDSLVGLNGAPLTPGLFERVTGRLHPGDPLLFQVRRDESLVEVAVAAAARPATEALIPRSLQVRLDSARHVFVARVGESLSRLGPAAAPELVERLVGAVPDVDVDVDVEEVVVTRGVGSGTAGAGVAMRPLAPYLYGADRVAGARFIELAPGLRHYFGVERGALTVEVLPGTPAHDAGLRAGDVVTAVGATPVDSPRALRSALGVLGSSGALLGIVRRGETLEVRLGG